MTRPAADRAVLDGAALDGAVLDGAVLARCLTEPGGRHGLDTPPRHPAGVVPDKQVHRWVSDGGALLPHD